MSHEWKIGDWVNDNGIRGYVYYVSVDGCVHYVKRSGVSDYFKPWVSCAEYLPECTGWEWTPKPKYKPWTFETAPGIVKVIANSGGRFAMFLAGAGGYIINGVHYSFERVFNEPRPKSKYMLQPCNRN